MNKIFSFFLITVIISLYGCSASMDKYSRNGGTLRDHFLTTNYGDVVRRANTYCSSIGAGQSNISKQSNGCLLFCGSEYDVYNFTCTPSQYNSPFIGTTSQTKSNNSCVLDSDCIDGLHCRYLPTLDAHVCRPVGWKASDENKTLTPISTTPNDKPIKKESLNLDDFKAQCKELGFKEKTPDFGNCVLQLNSSK